MGGRSSVEIREATPDDADPVVDLWAELATDQRRYGSHLRAEPNRTAVRETIARRVVADELLIADDEDVSPGLTGFVMFSHEHGVYEQDVTRGLIDALFVRSSSRGRGIGTRLLEAAETRLREAGVDAVALETLAGNVDGRRFYRRHGYDPHRIEFEKRLDEDDADGGADGGVDDVDEN
ncbi:N-acetyltransferase family protein [Halopenitus sp. H-Gu1]|uniref:GNAT family N-acetyltransferase n=1 Tax=Halopenitus sp. H-Gu1 TaxID=3242697 RepID=UPI00359EAC32